MVVDALGTVGERYTLASLRYDLSKLRAKGLVEKLPQSRRYRLLPDGYSICLVFLKLFERIYAPLTGGLLSPSRATPPCTTSTDRNSTAFTSASLTISTDSYKPSV